MVLGHQAGPPELLVPMVGVPVFIWRAHPHLALIRH